MNTSQHLHTPTMPPVAVMAAPPRLGRMSTFATEPLQASMATVLELLGGTPDDASIGCFDRFAVHRAAHGATLVHEGAHAAVLYLVQAGSFKRVKTAEDGYEHVLGFAWRGDLIGFDGVAAAHYAFGAEALEDSRVIALPLATLAPLRRRMPAFDIALQATLSREFTHVGEMAEAMAAVAAEVRLARFLVRLSTQMAERGQSARRLRLRMNRRDIASHLGLAHETISRCLRQLADSQMLRVDNREVEITDLDSLKRCARSTRGFADELAQRPRAAHREPHLELACAA